MPTTATENSSPLLKAFDFPPFDYVKAEQVRGGVLCTLLKKVVRIYFPRTRDRLTEPIADQFPIPSPTQTNEHRITNWYRLHATEGTTVITQPNQGPRDHGRGTPVRSISDCGWIWKAIGVEIRERKILSKPGRREEEGEKIELAMAETLSSHVTITLGGSGQVLKRGGAVANSVFSHSQTALGSKRSVRDRLGSDVDRIQLNSKRQRGDSNGVDGNRLTQNCCH
ncbi:hypothetical protein Acr_15g0010180 [Actinidia rufa]|uniref:Uncharacterized protein n=1 Tax=Actinidia rufa TaxID=165716 RepID=A0A7J0FW67_9ERIC|nr:hypothetical protein Acr_15g0010180 [Actinidia rufa]